MKSKFLFSALLSGLLVFTSCEDPIEVAIPEGETLFVVDAFITDAQQVQQVKLSTTSPYFSNTNVPVVTGGIVKLTDLVNGKVYSFSDLGTGYYAFSPSPADSFGIVGHDYRLDVNWNGYEYYSFSRLNRTTPIDTLIFVYEEGGQGFSKGYYPYIYGKDQTGANDFYWLKTYKNGIYINNPQNINVVEDGGGDGTDGLSFIPPNAFFNVTPFDAPYKLVNDNGMPDVCKVECYSINENTYEFLLQAQVQMTNSSSGLFATTPENVRTNITPVGNAPKAIGWFNMGAISYKVLPVTE
jgi:hypothetical protein